MFRLYDHPQGAYFVPYQNYSLKHSVIYFFILIRCVSRYTAQQAHRQPVSTEHRPTHT